MRPWPRSLRSRVVLLTVGPLAVMILLSGWATRRASERSIENALRGSLSDAGSVLLEMIDARRQTLLMQAEVIAQDPRFQEAFSGGGTAFAAASGDGLENVAQEYLSITDADFLEVVDRGGQHLARATRRREDLDGWTDVGPGHASLSEALEGLGSTDFFVSDAGPTLVADVPVFVEGRLAVVLRLGQVLDRDFVLEVARLTSAAVVVAQDGLVLAEAMTGPDLPAPDLIASLLPRPSPIPRVHPSISPVIRLKLDGHDWLEVEVRLPGLHEDGGFSTHLARDLRTEFAPWPVPIVPFLGWACSCSLPPQWEASGWPGASPPRCGRWSTRCGPHGGASSSPPTSAEVRS